MMRICRALAPSRYCFPASVSKPVQFLLGSVRALSLSPTSLRLIAPITHDRGTAAAALQSDFQHAHGSPGLQRSDLQSSIAMDGIPQIDVVTAVVSGLSRDARVHRLIALIDRERAPVLWTFHAPGLGGKEI